MPTPSVEISATLEDFESNAARAAFKVIEAVVRERGRCLMALSGGRTPCGVYRRLGDLLTGQSVEMSRVYLIFVDERMVPPDDADSNYGMIRREFMARAPISPLHIYRIRGEAAASVAAQDYERELETIFPLFDGRCDLVMLGIGEDGHTGSLFPETEVLQETQHKASAVFVPKLGAWRVTLTLPVINSARAVLFLATGKRKAAVVGKIFANSQPREDLPATLVQPESGTLRWMLDAEAAARILSERPSRDGSTPS